MHVHALREKASNLPPNKQDIKQAILNISAFKPSSDSLKGLIDCRCFPVKKPSGRLIWISSRCEFAIIDRREYGESFSKKIDMLDFSLEEVHSMKSFLVGLGLDEKFISNAVKEETKVEGGSIDHSRTNDMRRKSYAVCR
jgi:hypothetical protein